MMTSRFYCHNGKHVSIWWYSGPGTGLLALSLGGVEPRGRTVHENRPQEATDSRPGHTLYDSGPSSEVDGN
jgi:hypothetical protein